MFVESFFYITRPLKQLSFPLTMQQSVLPAYPFLAVHRVIHKSNNQNAKATNSFIKQAFYSFLLTKIESSA